MSDVDRRIRDQWADGLSSIKNFQLAVILSFVTFPPYLGGQQRQLNAFALRLDLLIDLVEHMM